jgi:iron complex outermembrane receptor protein
MPANFTTAANKTAPTPTTPAAAWRRTRSRARKNTCILNNQRIRHRAARTSSSVSTPAPPSRSAKTTLSRSNTPAARNTSRRPQSDPERGGERRQRHPAFDQQVVSGRQRRRAGRGRPDQPAADVTWSVADLGLAAPRTCRSTSAWLSGRRPQVGQLGLQGWPGDRPVSTAKNLLRPAIVTGQGLLNAGLKNGVLNPFGLQDAAGRNT